MTFQEIFKVIFENHYWQGYEKSVMLNNEYNTFFFAHDIGEHLRTIKKRETDEELKERIECTTFLNESLYKYLNKNIDKLQYLNANITMTQTSDKLEKNLAKVYEDMDLRSYIHNCLKDQILCDPNGLLYFSIDERDELAYPSFVSSSSIVWKETLRGHVKSVIISTEEGYKYFDSEKIYDFKKVDSKGLDYKSFNGESDIVSDSKNKVNFKIEEINSMGIYFIPVGTTPHSKYKSVYISFLDSSVSFFKKITSIGSEYDITELKQAFPKVFAYESKCTGYHNEPCDNGWCSTTNSECKRCNGTGVLISKSGQDAILLPMPGIERGAQLADLTKLYHEVKAPIETLEYQRKVIKETFEAAYQSIYGKQQEAKVNETATAKMIELESMNQSIYPLAHTFKRIYENSVSIISSMHGINNQNVSFKFPQKLIELSESELIDLIKFSKDTGLPSYIIKEYESRLAQTVFNQSKYKSRMFEIHRALNPFPDKELKDLVVLLDNEAITKDDFVLSINFDKFISEIAEEELNILDLDIDAVKNRLISKLEAYKDKLPQPIPLNLGN